eukprot:466970_1
MNHDNDESKSIIKQAGDKNVMVQVTDSDSDDDGFIITETVSSQMQSNSIARTLTKVKITEPATKKDIQDNNVEIETKKVIQSPALSSEIMTALAAAQKEAEKRLTHLNDGETKSKKKKSKKKDGKKEKKESKEKKK